MLEFIPKLISMNMRPPSAPFPNEDNSIWFHPTSSWCFLSTECSQEALDPPRRSGVSIDNAFVCIKLNSASTKTAMIHVCVSTAVTVTHPHKNCFEIFSFDSIRWNSHSIHVHKSSMRSPFPSARSRYYCSGKKPHFLLGHCPRSELKNMMIHNSHGKWLLQLLRSFFFH